MIIDASSKNSCSQPEINSSASTSSNGPSSDGSSNSRQSDGVGSTQSQGALDEGSTQTMNEGSTDPRKVPRSTGPRTPHGKTRSARNASKHKVLVGRILPEEASAAAYISEELTKDLNPHTVLEREIVLDLVVNRIQRRRIDKCNANEIVKAREHRFETIVDTEDQSQAEPWLRLTDTRRPDSVVRKRLTPEGCVALLGGLMANIHERGPSPEEDMGVLARVYGEESTTLGAVILFLYHGIRENHYQHNERDDKKKLEYERLRDEILKTLETEIQCHRDRIERKFTIVTSESSSNVMVPPPSIADSINRYYAANAREFTRLLDDLERVRRIQKA